MSDFRSEYDKQVNALGHPQIDPTQRPRGSVLSEAEQAVVSQVEAARADYDQAVICFLDAVRRFSELPISDGDKIELLRQAREQEEIAFAKYKQLLDKM
jgi:hypothetical protein